MRVERVRYFLAAVQTGSFRAAAARCGVSQPTLGEQVALLEEELDVVLLTRSRQGVTPTPAGRALIESMSRLAAAEDDLHRAAMGFGGAYRGRVTIGAISVLSEAVVAPVVGQLREHHPELRFTVSESSSSDIESRVLSGDLDFGVVTVPQEDPPQGLVRSALLSVPIGAIVPVDHALAEHDDLSWNDLSDWPIVTMRPGTVMWERLHRGLRRPDIAVEGMSARSVRVMVAHRAGIGILAPFDTAADVPGLKWIPLRDEDPVRIALVRRRDAQPSPSALTVRQLIRDRAAELLRSAAVTAPLDGAPS